MISPIAKILATLLLLGSLTSCGVTQPDQASDQARTNAQLSAAAPVVIADLEIIDIELCHKQNALAEGSINGFTSFLPPDSLICRARPDLLRAFEGFGVLFGTLSVACTFPGPAQAALPIFSVGGAAMSLVSFGLKGIQCDDPEPRLTAAQLEVVEARVCQMMGKTYQKGLGPVERSRCL